MKKKRIGLILASIHSGSASQVCSALIKEAQLFDTSFYIFPGGRLNAAQDSEYLRNPVYALANSGNIDGLISWASAIGGDVSLEDLNEFHKQFGDMPFVTLSQKIGSHSCVNFDAYNGMAELVKHFIQVHHASKIAFLRGPENHSSANDRFRAFCDTMAEAGFPVEGSNLISDPFEWREGKNAVIQLYEKRGLIPGRDFTVLLAASDLMAFDAIDYLHQKGFVVPDDYLAAGFNDMSKSRMLLSALTTVHMPYRTMGLNAYELILNELDNSSAIKRNINLFAPLVIRESCGCSLSALLKSPAVKNKGLTNAENASGAIQAGAKPVSATPATASLERIKENLTLELTKLFRLDITNQNAIIEPILNALWTKSTSLFLNLFSRAMSRFYENEMDVRIIYRALSILKGSPCMDSEYITSLEKDIFIILEQTSERYQEEIKSVHEERTKILNSLKCALISEYSFEGFTQAFHTYLPRLGINSAAIVLYTKNQSHFVGGFNKSRIFSEEEFFEREKIVPDHLANSFSSGIYLVQPIFADNRTFGHFVCSLSFFDGLLFEDLRSVISSAFKGISLFTKLTAAQKAAEEAEQAKTKFFATVGKDLVLPLNEIAQNTNELEQLLAKNDMLPDSVKVLVGKLKNNIARQLKKTNLIVDLTRSQSNELKFHNHLFYFQELFEAENSEYKPDKYPIVFGDKERIKQALQIYAENFNFSLKDCKVEHIFSGIRIVLPFTVKSEFKESWDNSSIKLANQIFLLQNCDLESDGKQVSVTLLWTNFLCNRKKSDVNQQPDLFVWNFTEHDEIETRTIYNLRSKEEFYSRPFICYDTISPAELEQNADFSDLFERKLGISQNSVLLVDCPEGIEKNWKVPIPVERIKAEDDLMAAIDISSPSVIVLGNPDFDAVEKIRTNSSTELCPIIIVGEKLGQMETLEKFFKVQKLLLCNTSIAVSPEFGQKVRTLLSGEAMLSADTGVIVKKTIIYFNNHGSEYISRWKLSETVHTSEDYLTRVFHKETGLSPWEYLTRLRTSYACVLLRQTTESIASVAEKSGFQDQAYFCRVFRKIIGTTPGRYRRGLD